jgi:hypothetical protein
LSRIGSSNLCWTAIQFITPFLSITVPLSASGAASGKTLGFVATDFIYASYDGGPDACPEGLTPSARDLFMASLAPEERERLSKPDNDREINQRMGRRGNLNACSNPTEFEKHDLKLFQSKTHVGLNLDGKGSTTEQTVPGGTCAHENFVAPDGETGIDNQLGRLQGCIRGYRHDADVDKYSVQVLASGEYSVLIEITGVDSTEYDDDVEIAMFSGKDPVAQDPTGKILAHQSVTVHDDARYHNIVRGRIKNGVLMSDPFDLRLKYDAQVIHSEFYLRDARVRFSLKPNGNLEGLIGGYFDIEKRYEHIKHSGVVTSWLNGYDCPGFFDGLHKLADGNKDPKTGKCTTISSAMRVEAIPAFVIHKSGSKLAQFSK